METVSKVLQEWVARKSFAGSPPIQWNDGACIANASKPKVPRLIGRQRERAQFSIISTLWSSNLCGSTANLSNLCNCKSLAWGLNPKPFRVFHGFRPNASWALPPGSRRRHRSHLRHGDACGGCGAWVLVSRGVGGGLRVDGLGFSWEIFAT